MSSTLEQPQASISAAPLLAACPDCGNTAVRDRGRCRLPAFLDTLPTEERAMVESAAESRLYHCDQCGLGFRHPMLSEDLLQRMYAAMPTERWQYESHNVAWTLAQKWLQRHHAQTDRLRILDVGAFDGAFLKTLPSTWDRQAIEPSAAARRDLEQTGIPCVTDFLSQPRQEDAGTFDVVTMFDVFEHLPNPSDSLNHALAYLKPGGHLLLSTGNCDHWTWRLLGGDQWYCEPAQHIRFASHRYFHHYVNGNPARISTLMTHPHQQANILTKTRESFETVVFAALRDRPWWLPAIKIALKLPGLGYLRHKTTAPYTPAIGDHLFVALQKSI